MIGHATEVKVHRPICFIDPDLRIMDTLVVLCREVVHLGPPL